MQTRPDNKSQQKPKPPVIDLSLDDEDIVTLEHHVTATLINEKNATLYDTLNKFDVAYPPEFVTALLTFLNSINPDRKMPFAYISYTPEIENMAAKLKVLFEKANTNKSPIYFMGQFTSTIDYIGGMIYENTIYFINAAGGKISDASQQMLSGLQRLTGSNVCLLNDEIISRDVEDDVGPVVSGAIILKILKDLYNLPNSDLKRFKEKELNTQENKFKIILLSNNFSDELKNIYQATQDANVTAYRRLISDLRNTQRDEFDRYFQKLLPENAATFLTIVFPTWKRKIIPSHITKRIDIDRSRIESEKNIVENSSALPSKLSAPSTPKVISPEVATSVLPTQSALPSFSEKEDILQPLPQPVPNSQTPTAVTPQQSFWPDLSLLNQEYTIQLEDIQGISDLLDFVDLNPQSPAAATNDSIKNTIAARLHYHQLLFYFHNKLNTRITNAQSGQPRNLTNILINNIQVNNPIVKDAIDIANRIESDDIASLMMNFYQGTLLPFIARVNSLSLQEINSFHTEFCQVISPNSLEAKAKALGEIYANHLTHKSLFIKTPSYSLRMYALSLLEEFIHRCAARLLSHFYNDATACMQDINKIQLSQTLQSQADTLNGKDLYRVALPNVYFYKLCMLIRLYTEQNSRSDIDSEILNYLDQFLKIAKSHTEPLRLKPTAVSQLPQQVFVPVANRVPSRTNLPATSGNSIFSLPSGLVIGQAPVRPTINSNPGNTPRPGFRPPPAKR